MELFEEIVGGWNRSTIFTKSFKSDVLIGFEYASDRNEALVKGFLKA